VPSIPKRRGPSFVAAAPCPAASAGAPRRLFDGSRVRTAAHGDRGAADLVGRRPCLEGLRIGVPAGTRVWVNVDYFDGYDQKYAIGAIRDFLLRRGARLMPDRGSAEVVVEIRSGALSTNSDNMLLGLPSLTLPVPTVGATQTPEVALAKRENKVGVAKIGITIYDAKTGALLPYSPSAPTVGLSRDTDWGVMSLFGWKRTDALPAGSE